MPCDSVPKPGESVLQVRKTGVQGALKASSGNVEAPSEALPALSEALSTPSVAIPL